MGVLIGGIIGLIIGAIILNRTNAKARAHREGVNKLVSAGGAGGRAALDKRIPAARAIDDDALLELQSQRLAALAGLGELEAIEAELAAHTGAPVRVGTLRIIGRTALAVKGRDVAENARRVEAEITTLEAAKTNQLTLRALRAWVPLARAAAGEHVLSESEREEVRRFNASDVVKKLVE